MTRAMPYTRVGMAIIAGALVIVAASALAGLLGVKPPTVSKHHPEVSELGENPLADFRAYREYFENLARQKGAVYAFEVLDEVPMPPHIDTHLLAHYVGYILYDQKGIKGMQDCTPRFRNACSHSIVIDAFLEYGDGALKEIARACSEAPGGRGSFTMCYHGLGHGILAYLKYDFERALPVCKQAADAGEEFNRNAGRGYLVSRFTDSWYECVGGLVMEMTSGIHDKNAWGKMAPRFIPDDDPLMPCDAPYIVESVRPACYTYLTDRLLLAAGAERGQTPDVEAVRTAFSYCGRIPEKEEKNRAACFGGLGKDFIGFVLSSDTRDVGAMTDEQLRAVHRLCALAPTPEGVWACRSTVLGSLFWGGENSPNVSLSFCRLSEDPTMRNDCYDELTRNALFFLGNTPAIGAVCKGLPEPQRDYCILNGT